MLFLWLCVWLLSGTPDVTFSGHWNNWAVALVICGVLTLLSVGD